MFGIAALMFYTGQWGGGDSKMLIGFGAVFGLPFPLITQSDFLGSFLLALFVNILLAGVIYAFVWSFILAIKYRKRFSAALNIGLKKNLRLRRYALAISALLLITSVILPENGMKLSFIAIGLVVILFSYMTVFSKAIESAAMIKRVNPAVLTEGDWIAKDIVVGKKIVAGPKDLGVSKKQIALLKRLYGQRKIRKIVIKTGIPFVPSFLAALLITAGYGNVFVLFLRNL